MIDEKNKRRNEVNFFYNGIDYQEAIELLEGVEQKQLDNDSSLLTLKGLINKNQGNYPEALECYEKDL